MYDFVSSSLTQTAKIRHTVVEPYTSLQRVRVGLGVSCLPAPE